MYEFIHGRSVGRITAPVGKNQFVRGGDDEIPTQLQEILAGFGRFRKPTRKDQSQVSCEHMQAEKHRPPPAFHPECSIGNSLGVASDGQRRQRHGNRTRRRLRDYENIGSGLSNFRDAILHLDEVGQARYSPDVPQEDEQQWDGAVRQF